jgi:hypothetical protein
MIPSFHHGCLIGRGTGAFDGRLPPGASNVQVLTATQLDDVADAVELLALARHSPGDGRR